MTSYPLVREAIVDIQRNVYALLSGSDKLLDDKQRTYIQNVDRCAGILLAEYDGYLAELLMATTAADALRWQHALKLDRTPLAIIATSCYLARRVSPQSSLKDVQIQYIEAIERSHQAVVDELTRWTKDTLWNHEDGTG